MKLICLALILMVCQYGACLAQGGKPSGKSPAMPAEARGKLFDGEVINKDVIIEVMTAGTGADAGAITFSSRAVLFDYGSARLREASFPQLTEIAKALNDPALEAIPYFFVDGHTCSIGTPERNCRLSAARAQSMVSFLVQKGGVSPDRLKARGFGQKDPVVSNDTDENRHMNRRVVLKSGFLSLDRDRELQCNPGQ